MAAATMSVVRTLPACVKLVSVRGTRAGVLLSTKRTFADEAKQKKIAVITGASRYIYCRREKESWEILHLKFLSLFWMFTKICKI